MDQDLGWWAHVLFEGWRERPGPRYQQLSAAILDAIEARTLREGVRVPAERHLAAALGVSRGTVVACLDQLTAAGVLRRRQGAGTFVLGRPGWARAPEQDPAAALLLRRLGAGREVIDLSLSVPAGIEHLPPWNRAAVFDGLHGHGLDPAGCELLRERIAEHLTLRQRLPTTAGQLIITTGARQALALLVAVSGPGTAVLTGCPTSPALTGVLPGRPGWLIPVPGDGAGGIDPAALGRAARATEPGLVYLAPTGHDPTGGVLALSARETLLRVAQRSGLLVVEDLSSADLVFEEDAPVPAPLSALDDRVVAVGSTSKLLWAGLRVGWVRASEPVRAALVRAQAAAGVGSSIPAQLLAAELLAGVDGAWLRALRAALRVRRDFLAGSLGARLPAWRLPQLPAAGLSLWVELPLADAEAFAHVAARHGVAVGRGRSMCADGAHLNYLRISFAEQVDVLDLGVERLAAAWEVHSEDLAATPVAPAR